MYLSRKVESLYMYYYVAKAVGDDDIIIDPWMCEDVSLFIPYPAPFQRHVIVKRNHGELVATYVHVRSSVAMAWCARLRGRRAATTPAQHHSYVQQYSSSREGPAELCGQPPKLLVLDSDYNAHVRSER